MEVPDAAREDSHDDDDDDDEYGGEDYDEDASYREDDDYGPATEMDDAAATLLFGSTRLRRRRRGDPEGEEEEEGEDLMENALKDYQPIAALDTYGREGIDDRDYGEMDVDQRREVERVLEERDRERRRLVVLFINLVFDAPRESIHSLTYSHVTTRSHTERGGEAEDFTEHWKRSKKEWKKRCVEDYVTLRMKFPL